MLVCTAVFFVSFVVSCFLATRMFFEGSPYPDIRAEPAELNFGTISETEIQTGEYVLTNHGNVPVSITDVIPGCGCTNVNFRSGRLEPGEKTSIFVRMNPYGRKGELTSSVVIAFVNRSSENSTPSSLSVGMRANIQTP